MDARLIDPFVSAVQNVFRTMVSVDVEVGKPYVSRNASCSADVSGVVGLSGEATGWAVLSFPELVACRTASSFAGVEIGVDHPDFVDAIGELANMVAGNAKKHLCGLRCGLSLPRVVVGRVDVTSQSDAVPRLIIPCRTTLGDFFLEVHLRAGKAIHASVGAS